MRCLNKQSGEIKKEKNLRVFVVLSRVSGDERGTIWDESAVDWQRHLKSCVSWKKNVGFCAFELGRQWTRGSVRFRRWPRGII